MTSSDTGSTRLASVLVCPTCHGELDWRASASTCRECGASFGTEEGVPKFHALASESSRDASFQADHMQSRSLGARIFNFGKRYVNSEYSPRDFLAEALAAVPPGGIALEFGSGSRRLRPDVINLDRFRFPNVDVLADVAATPLRAACADLIILDSLLEHVPTPQTVVAEAHRVLKPGGTVLALVPFLFPYHGYPKHYGNFSKDGVELLFERFARCRVEPAIGPSAALTNLFSEYVAVGLAREGTLAYTAIKGATLLPIFLLKYLDKFWKPEAAMRVASMLCATATK